MAGCLSGIRIIDFGQYLAGPLTAQLMADQGAEVIRVDPPGGPILKSDINAVLQRGKRSIVLNLEEVSDRDTARRLIESADVLIENFTAGVMRQHGLDAEAITNLCPQLIYCSIPPFASDDMRASLPVAEGLVGAAAGLYPPRDFKIEGAPIFNTLPLASVLAAIVAGNSIVAALIARERAGGGQHIEVSMFDAAYEIIRFYGDRMPGHYERPMLGGTDTPAIADHYQCKDGRFVHVSWLEGRQLELFARKIGRYEDWAAEGILCADMVRLRQDPATSARIKHLLAEVFKQRCAAEWESVANPDCDLAVCQTTREWMLHDSQAKLAEAVISLADPEYGETQQIGYPVSLTKTPTRTQGARRLLDADRDAILTELHRSKLPVGQATRTRSTAKLKGALSGIRAVDVTQLLAGPTACRILAEYGADVVQITNPNARTSQAYHLEVNTGKRSMLLDLKKPGAMEVFWKLIERADIFSTNFSSSVAARLGVDEAEVRRRKPNIIFSRISAHGLQGPRSEYRGHEQVGQAVTGMQIRYGMDVDHPIMQPFPVCDIGTGHLGAFAILLAIFHRARGGDGQRVGASLAHTAALYQTPYMLSYADKKLEETGGLGCLGHGPLERFYKASDRWFFLFASNIEVLSAVEGLEGLTLLSPDQIEAVLERRLKHLTAATWVERFASGAPYCGAHVNNTIDDAMRDTWACRHGLSRDVDFPYAGPGRLVGPAKRLSRTPMAFGSPAHPVGWDGEEIVRELGLEHRIAELLANGALKAPTTPDLGAVGSSFAA